MTSDPRPRSSRLRQTPLYALLSVQLLALVPVAGLVYLHPDLGLGSALFVQSLCAAVLSRWGFRQGRWWLPVHVFFLPLAVLLLQFGIHPAWYLLALLLSVLVFGAAWRGRVPLYISSRAALQALDQILPREPNLHFVDVGCGSGVVLSTVRRLRPSWKVSGIEAALLPWLWARMRLAWAAPDVRVYRANFWRMPLGQVDVVYAYLSPTPMFALWRKLEQDKGCRHLISYRFPIPGIKPELSVEVEEGSHLYRWDLRKDGHA